jgi:hypothetical protein
MPKQEQSGGLPAGLWAMRTRPVLLRELQLELLRREPSQKLSVRESLQIASPHWQEE